MKNFLIVRDPSSMIRRPVSVLPVNAIARTRSSVASFSPTILPEPVTTLRTPEGRWLLKIRAHSRTVSGQYVAGLRTTVLPVAIAATNRLKLRRTGEFRAEITAVTPRGRLRAYTGWLRSRRAGFDQAGKSVAIISISSMDR